MTSSDQGMTRIDMGTPNPRFNGRTTQQRKPSTEAMLWVLTFTELRPVQPVYPRGDPRALPSIPGPERGRGGNLCRDYPRDRPQATTCSPSRTAVHRRIHH